jgi:regulator of sigma E protease
MDMIWNIAIIAFGFGAMIFIHELGHFIAAKLSKIKVEAFSIGFPPVVFAIKRTTSGIRLNILPDIISRNTGNVDENGQDIKEAIISLTFGGQMKEGETEYRIGLIPLGGFVKMMGQEDVGAVKKSDDPRSYANKPAHTKIFVLASGVIFNAVSAVFIFMAVFLIGINMPPAIIGGVVADSPAEKAGIVAGDEVIEVNGEKTYIEFTSIQMAAAMSDINEPISLKIKRQDNSIYDVQLTSVLMPGESLRMIGARPPRTLSLENVSDNNALESATGMRGGDTVKAINGTKVSAYWELADIAAKTLVPEVTLMVDRNGSDVTTKVPMYVKPLGYRSSDETKLSHICSILPRLKLIDIVPSKTPSPLKKGDILLSVGGVENPSYAELRKVTEEHCDKKMEVKVLRKDASGVEKELAVEVFPKKSAKLKRVLMGITMPEYDMQHPIVAKTIDGKGVGKKLDIPTGATITKIAGTAVSNYYDIIQQIKQNDGKIIAVEYKTIDGKDLSAELNLGQGGNVITAATTFDDAAIPFKHMKRMLKAKNCSEAIVYGLKKTLLFIEQTYVTIPKMLSGAISPENLMGPVGILSFSYQIVSEEPIIYYVFLMGLMSTGVAVFNFLPMPPLDGGLAVIVLIEKIKGSALSEKTLGVIAYAGWAMIMTLFVYVTFNDVVRSFF